MTGSLTNKKIKAYFFIEESTKNPFLFFRSKSLRNGKTPLSWQLIFIPSNIANEQFYTNFSRFFTSTISS